jgi:uncharacterized protein (TIGR03032 family)
MSGTASRLHHASEPRTPAFELTASRQFTAWFAEQKASLAFTTYQAGKLFLLGLQPDGQLSIFNRTFERCMGLWASPERLLMSSLYQLWRFENALPPSEMHQGYDRLYLPQLAWTTGDLDVHDIAVAGNGGHDIAVEAAGRPVFVNTLFSCLATVSETHSFTPLWRPPFISRLAAEDRCHLNGLALKDGSAGYVTAVSRADVADGWRDRRTGGGVLVDVAANELVLEGLSMPHSPRWHDAGEGEWLWLLDSGSGWFGHADLERGRFERITFCPGYARGLACRGPFAVIGLSKPRENRTFTGLPLDDELVRHDAEPRCGLMVIDLRTGDAVHWLRIDDVVEELYDVAVLPAMRRPMALGLKTDEIRRMITVDAPEPL